MSYAKYIQGIILREERQCQTKRQPASDVPYHGEYGIKRLIRQPERSYIEVYNLETIAALAFRVESFGAAKVRKACWKGLCTGEKRKRRCSCRYLRAASPKNIGRHDDISTCQHFNTPTCQHTNVPTLVCWYVPPEAQPVSHCQKSEK